MPSCMNPMAHIPPMFKVTMTATTNRISRGISFLRTTRRLWRGSTNGFTAWKITQPMCEKLVKPTSISSSRSLCWRHRWITGGIDERARLHRLGDDDRRGGARVERGAHRFRRRRSAEYRVQPGAPYGRAENGAHLRIRRLWRTSRALAAFHRRSDLGQRRRIGGLDGRPVRVVSAKGL